MNDPYAPFTSQYATRKDYEDAARRYRCDALQQMHIGVNKLIASLPTGELRDKMTDINIFLVANEEAIKKGKE